MKPIETLNDLFSALFKSAEGALPVVRRARRPVREDAFALLFPNALVEQFADKSKSNLTWFFNDDARNKSIKRALIAMLLADVRGVRDEVHAKCHALLWPEPGQPAFDADVLLEALGRVRLDEALNARLSITRAEPGRATRLEALFDIDPSAALARMLLTLAVQGPNAEDVSAMVWRRDPGANYDFLKQDATVAGSIRYFRTLDLESHHAQAFDGFERIAAKLGRPAETADESAMYGRMGDMLYEGEGHYRDEKAAEYYYLLGCFEGRPASYYRYAMRASGQSAREALEKAAALGCAPAIRALGDAWFNGSARLNCARSLDDARRCYQRGLAIQDADGAYCGYMLGRIYESQNQRAAAANAYRVARDGGSAEAAERLAQLDWSSAGAPEAGDDAQRYCLMNGYSGVNPLFLESLRGRWQVTLCDRDIAGVEAAQEVLVRRTTPERALDALARGLYWGGAAEFPELAIALLSADEEANLFQAIALLGALRRLAESLGARGWELVDRVRLYVLADRALAAPMLDAAFAGMGEWVFRLRLCDPALDAADQLFAAAPLFLPGMSGADRTRLNLIGCGDTAMAILRRAIALPLAQTPEIHVHGADAEAMRLRFEAACPGVFSAPQEVRRAVPEFHTCALEAALPVSLRRPQPGPLAEGNYYVVATEDDGLNLRIAMGLRAALLKLGAEFDNLPFIAVRLRNPSAAWLAGGLSAEGGGALRWSSQYDLYAFGSQDMYGYDALRADALERRAQQAHMLNLGLANTQEARRTAMGSYYQRQQSREDARATAASLIYRMALAGIQLPGWKLYGSPEEEARLGPSYTEWLRDEAHLQAAAQGEHERRCLRLLSEGWEAAAPEQVAAYVRRGNPGPQLALARLDPFLCGWDALQAGRLLEALREAVPNRPVKDPRRGYIAAVRDTETILKL